MNMSFFIWHIYYYRAFCTVTNDDFAHGNLLSHPLASFVIPTIYLLIFLLLTTSWPSYLFWFCISFTFLSHFFPTCSTLSLLVQLVQIEFCILHVGFWIWMLDFSFCISFTFLSHFFPTCSTLSLPLCLCSLSRQNFAFCMLGFGFGCWIFHFAFLLHFCRISFLHVQLSLCLSACAACLDRILRLTASRDESAGCTNFPHWTLASSLLCVFVQVAKCICLSSHTYLFRFDVTSK